MNPNAYGVTGQMATDIFQTVTPVETLAKLADPRLCVHHGHLRCVMAVRRARRQEDRKGEWSALPLEPMSSVATISHEEGNYQQDHLSPGAGDARP